VEPVSAFIAILLMMYAGKKAIGDAIVDNNLAKQGIVSPRMQAKHGQSAAAKVAKYGLSDFLRDAWNDYWPRRADALIAARNAKAANPGEKVRFRDRLAAGTAVIRRGVQKSAPAVRRLVEPVPPKTTAVPVPAVDPAPALAVDTGDVDEGTRRFVDGGGQEEYRDGQWRPVPKTPDTFGGKTADPAPTGTPAGGAVSAPTGEAVNYETTVNELEKLIHEQRQHLDSCIAAQGCIAAAKGAIGDMQDSYRASSAAAGSTHEHLAAKHLDGVTLAHTGTTADAMPAGAVDSYYDQLEVMEEMARQRREAAEVALHSTEAALANVQAKYGDAHATVAGDLSGDSSFLDSGGVAGGLSVRETQMHSAPHGSLEHQLRFDPDDPHVPLTAGGGGTSVVHDEFTDGAPTYTVRPGVR
jgi:hypothetical protein